MHAFDFLKNPSQAAEASFVVVSGDDLYLRREVLDGLVRGLLGGPVDEMAITKFAADRVKLADVLDELRTLPFLVKRRVVIVEDADAFVTANRKALEELADAPPTPGGLVLSVKTWPGNTKLAKAVAKVGLTIEAKTPEERDLPAWLVHLAKTRSKAKLAPDAAKLLVDLVGAEVGILASEVEKLAVSVGERKEIQRDDVSRMVGAGRVDKIWRALDASTTGRPGQALADLERLLESGEHPVGLLAAMTASLRKVHHSGQLRRAKRDLEGACREVGGVYPQRIAEQHAHLGPARVDKLPAILLQADLDLKGSSSLPGDVILERLIVRLGRKRKD